eukprot:TRINITY_DN11404_c0_g1_i2.p1 TRINITY_DN11404_c0_g1~~TRINITY_DN11404_c0_g1_i2.p1  ORF type:complete len:100 (-),score=16.35 TRINITY_DN11404_c0_g1_i2:152-451(-)
MQACVSDDLLWKQMMLGRCQALVMLVFALRCTTARISLRLLASWPGSCLYMGFPTTTLVGPIIHTSLFTTVNPTAVLPVPTFFFTFFFRRYKKKNEKDL